eukprot:TRINITY_DN8404_c0_g1_i1.p1 TRINITY_DN8404_c0_g1~~TRINITY_DN8404_c0_g1_i1.p1  ORF type:complete len:450 (+),score=49.18 TRINITY_DN8404_c0_g1_i1:71-1420(+)
MSYNTDLEDGWETIGHSQCSPIVQQNDAQLENIRRTPKQSGFFSSMYLSAKTRLYNLYRPLSRTLPKFSSSPIHLLGRTYDPKTELHEFLIDFMSRIWFTYRNFTLPIEQTQYSTDMGWGCMCRTGQMLLAHVFIIQYLNRDWRISKRQQTTITMRGSEESESNADGVIESDSNSEHGGSTASMWQGTEDRVYREILSWFLDDPATPYGIHAIATTAKTYFEKGIGEWFEPTTIARTIAVLVTNHSPGGLRVYVPCDGTIYLDEIQELCRIKTKRSESQKYSNDTRKCEEEEEENDDDNDEEEWTPCLILIPVRLGLDKINPIYLSGLKAVLCLPQSVGIIGGKPQSSFYFVGCQDDRVFYFDPHVVNNSADAISRNGETFFPTDSYHTDIPQVMELAEIDPSMAVGFYCHGRLEFEDFCERLRVIMKENKTVYSIVDKKPSYLKRRHH